ncbi:CinA family protein [Nocardioides sp. Y6]|uniref:CinA family protein n=2 Tax=Nocardioides malaquae TaxID=2773426 RepID=A0ABR9RVK8_9ACTN|nr:CinA family protein [Nocardioides malaquae]
MREEGLTLATAESLTGGALAATITGVAGASSVYRGGVVAYATEVKADVLGVPVAVVEQHGVVSQECAAAMAQGARRLVSADVAVATTGVAGPSTQEGHPPGTVFVAVASGQGVTARRLALRGDRAAVQAATVAEALALLHEILPGEEPRVR